MGVWERWDLKGRSVKNRLIRSATSMRMADRMGFVTEKLVEVHRKLCEGGIGIDITGHAFVSPEGRAREGQIGVFSDEHVKGLRELSKVAEEKGVLILLQISHAGMLSVPLSGDVIAPSPVKGARAMSTGEVERVMEDFARASRRAEKAGFSGVQIHGAHGYLVSQFISPLINRRRDRFGGREGGIRFLKELVEAVRGSVSKDFIVSIKIGADEKEGGNTIEDVAKILEKVVPLGIDLVEVSRGLGSYGFIVRKGIGDEPYNLGDALFIKENLNAPVAVVGGIRSVSTAEGIVSKGIDGVSLCRPLIRDPYLPEKWALKIVERSDCISCNRCAWEKGYVRCHNP